MILIDTEDYYGELSLVEGLITASNRLLLLLELKDRGKKQP